MVELISMSRLLALDVGDKRIGVAVSDATGMLVTPVETVHRKNSKLDIARICKLVDEHEASAIVVGLPKNMDGTEGEQAAKVKSFAKKLTRETRLEVHFEDERLSTFTATERLVERGIDTGRNRDLVDMEAAAVILQSYLERQSK
ncbi:MAG: Holliday junction resolvase RuvX [Candidatus Melainabacteria bacterium]|nr:MAG: Holliday junction resolvase RuvX [Candidatus Melainabacteria bacterium]